MVAAPQLCWKQALKWILWSKQFVWLRDFNLSFNTTQKVLVCVSDCRGVWCIRALWSVAGAHCFVKNIEPLLILISPTSKSMTAGAHCCYHVSCQVFEEWHSTFTLWHFHILLHKHYYFYKHVSLAYNHVLYVNLHIVCVLKAQVVQWHLVWFADQKMSVITLFQKIIEQKPSPSSGAQTHLRCHWRFFLPC